MTFLKINSCYCFCCLTLKKYSPCNSSPLSLGVIVKPFFQYAQWGLLSYLFYGQINRQRRSYFFNWSEIQNCHIPCNCSISNAEGKFIFSKATSLVRRLSNHFCEVSPSSGPAPQFQSRTVPSEPPETRCSALWSNMTLWTSSSWPTKLDSCPDLSSRVFTVPSLLARATIWPGKESKESGGHRPEAPKQVKVLWPRRSGISDTGNPFCAQTWACRWSDTFQKCKSNQ